MANVYAQRTEDEDEDKDETEAEVTQHQINRGKRKFHLISLVFLLLSLSIAHVGGEEQLCPVEAFSGYDELQKALNEGQEEIVLCSLLTLAALETLTIASNVKMGCASPSPCTIEGGREQIILKGENISSVQFTGISFSKATQTSVSIYTGNPQESTKITFRDCVWEGLTGTSAINIDPTGYKSIESSSQLNTDGSSPGKQTTNRLFEGRRAQEKAELNVEINGCTFQDNTVDQSLITHYSGLVVVTETLFSGNEVNEGLIGSVGGTLQVTNSEFRDTIVLTGPAPLTLGLSAVLELSEGNCGDDSDTCNGIIAQVGNCTKAKCETVCQAFDVCLPLPTPSPSANQSIPMMATSSVPTVTYAPTGATIESILPTITSAPSFTSASRPSGIQASMEVDPTNNLTGSFIPQLDDDDLKSVVPTVTPVPSMISTLTGAPTLTVFPSSATDMVPSEQSDDNANYDGSTIIPSVTDIPSATYVPTKASMAEPCPFDDSLLGYADVESLAAGLDGGLITDFVLCPSTTLSGLLTIQADRKDVTSITCADQTCSWEEGESHISIQSNIKLVVKGIAFRQATNVSIIVDYDSSDATLVTFQNCSWERNEGVATILLSGSTMADKSNVNTNTTVGANKGTRRLQQSASVSLEQCAFTANKVNNVVLVTRGASLDVSNCTFIKNIAEGSVLASKYGVTSISTTRFEDNVFNESIGLASLSAESKVKTDGSCVVATKESERATSSTKKCGGIWVEAGPDSCTDSTSNECIGTCQVLDACKSEACINDWDSLRQEILSVPPEGTVIVLCADTVFDLDSTEVDDPAPLIISENNTVIKCGESGDRENSCVISGGEEQIRFTKAPTGVGFKGVTFVGSRRAAILAEGIDEAQAFFRSCAFTGHAGQAVVFNGDISSFQSDVESILELKAPTNQGMVIGFDACLFQENKVTLATIISTGGSLVMDDNVFIGNSGQVGVSASLFKSALDVTSSCFIGNTGELATVYVDESSLLQESTDNFSSENIIDSPESCSDLLLDTKECVAFTARVCGSTVDVPVVAIEKYTECFSNFSSLVTAMSASEGGDQFEICSDTEFDLSDKSTDEAFLQIKSNNITLTCGKDGSRINHCLFKGGENQIEISGKLEGVKLLGITFVGASAQTVLVKGSAPFSLEFADCEFRDASGSNVIEIQSSDSPKKSPTQAPAKGNSSIADIGSDDVFTGGRRLAKKNDVGVSVKFLDCSFLNNTVVDNVISIKGAMVNITACGFESNSVGSSVVDTKESGSLRMGATCFTDNIFDGLQGLLSIDLDSVFDMSENFGSGNIDSSGTSGDHCAGLSNESSDECVEFDLDACQSSPLLKCFDQWDVLAKAVMIASAMQLGANFSLCDDTTLLPGEFDVIEIDTSDTVIQCGASGESLNRCAISGGGTHFKISGSPTGVVFQGISFLSASIVAIDAAGDSDARLSVIDCFFAYNTGLAAIAVYGGDLQSQKSSKTRRHLAVENLPPPTSSMTIDVRQCYFEDNNVDFSSLALLGGNAIVSETGFFANTGESSGVGVWFGGSIKISSSCFKGNSTSILVKEGSTIDNAEGVFGTGNSKSACVGALVGDQCNKFSADSCPIEEVVVIPPVNGCYDNWLALNEAIQMATANDRKTVKLTVCENTMFDLKGVDDSMAPIEISGNSADKDLTISCGTGTSQDGNCTVSGGRGHFKISSSVGKLLFNGFTFVNASIASIQASGEQEAFVTFTSCRWHENRGNAVIIIYNENSAGSIYSEKDFTNLEPPKDSSMTMKLDRCNISSNRAAFATILNLGGALDVLETVIADNRVSRVGAVGALYGAAIGISASCLSGNAAMYPGAIFVDQTSNITLVRNTFGNENSVSIGDCTGIFFERKGSCVDNGDCTGDCVAFDAKTCKLDIDLGTISPTLSPSQSYSIAPSMGLSEGSDTQLPNQSGSIEQTKNDGKSSKTGLIIGLLVPILLCICAAVAFLVIRKKKAAVDDGENPKKAKKSRGNLTRIDEADEDDDDDYDDDETRPLEDGRDEEQFLDEHEDAPTKKKGGFAKSFGFGRKRKSGKGDNEGEKESMGGQEILVEADSAVDDGIDLMESGINDLLGYPPARRGSVINATPLSGGEYDDNGDDDEHISNVQRNDEAFAPRQRSITVNNNRDQVKDSSEPSLLNDSFSSSGGEQEHESHIESDREEEGNFRRNSLHLSQTITTQPLNDALHMEDALVMPTGAYVEGTMHRRDERSHSPALDRSRSPELEEPTQKAAGGMSRLLHGGFGAKKRATFKNSMDHGANDHEARSHDGSVDSKTIKDFVRIPRSISKRAKKGGSSDSVESLSSYRDAPTTY